MAITQLRHLATLAQTLSWKSENTPSAHRPTPTDWNLSLFRDSLDIKIPPLASSGLEKVLPLFSLQCPEGQQEIAVWIF